MSIKSKLLKITEEHKMAMSLNTKTMMGIVKIHEKPFANKENELSQVNKDLQSFKVPNQELLQKIKNKLETYKTTFAKNDSSCRNPEIKPSFCKYCDESFVQVHEVKEYMYYDTYI